MWVCGYVGRYVCTMYACVYVCLSVRPSVRLSVCMDGWMDGCSYITERGSPKSRNIANIAATAVLFLLR